MNRPALLDVGLLAVLLALSLVACACAPAPSPSPTDTYLTDLVNRAKAGGADEQQIATLEAAAARGEVTYEDASEQLEHFFECVEGLGMTPIREDDQELAPGYRVPSYTAQIPDAMYSADPDLVAYQACNTKHLDFVMQGLYLQPKAVELENAEMEAHQTDIQACITSNGGDADPAATTDELINEILAVHESTNTWCWDLK